MKLLTKREIFRFSCKISRRKSNRKSIRRKVRDLKEENNLNSNLLCKKAASTIITMKSNHERKMEEYKQLEKGWQ